MANDTRKPPADRRRDAEALAATIFARLFPASRGAKNPDHVAREAIEAARAFFRECDAGLSAPAADRP